jgi:16S rRNA (cytosine967-C5)-methyltransferase
MSPAAGDAGAPHRRPTPSATPDGSGRSRAADRAGRSAGDARSRAARSGADRSGAAAGAARPDRRGGGAEPRRPAARQRPSGGGRNSGDPARLASYQLLCAVRERGAYANLVLPGLLRERGLTGRDAAFATELGYGTVRARGTLDAIIARAANRPADQIDPPVLDLLRLGAYQLLRTRVPSHAAVSETVALVPGTVGPRPVGFVNAVLRRVSERDEEAWLAAVAPPYEKDPIGHLALRYAHPQWIVAAFADALGGDLTETARALAADDSRPETHLVARPGRIDRDALLADAHGEPGPWSPYAVRLPSGGDPGDLAAIRDGRAAVQDEGSQLCALAAATAAVDGPDSRWLDLCAGPGGKAALLGALAVGRDARLLAVERNPTRAALVAATTRGLPVVTVNADGTAPPWEPRAFDRVLVDAPCTGLGALRRRPESRWRREPSDVPSLTALQRKLLASAIDATRPGGITVYVTCSPHLAETRAVVADATRRQPVEQLDARPLFADMPELGAGPHVQLWPHLHGTDAMFCAVLRRR